MIDPQASHPIIAEWVKVLIGTVVGFVSGTLADVVKTTISDRRKLKRISVAVYNELCLSYLQVVIALRVLSNGEGNEKQVAEIMRTIKTRAFDAANAQPDVFFQMKACRHITVLYNYFHIMGIPTQKPERTVGLAKRFVHMFDIYLRRNLLDTPLLNKIAPTIVKASLAKPISDKELQSMNTDLSEVIQ